MNAVSTKESLLPYHDHRFDSQRSRAERFTRDTLRLGHSYALGRLAIVHEDDRAEVARKTGIIEWSGGLYDPRTREAVATASPIKGEPLIASHRLIGYAVHELVHGATIETPEENNEHAYWLEALSGIGEVSYLNTLVNESWRERVEDYVLSRAGVDVWVPASFRYFGDREGERANATQGLIAASGFAISQRASGIGTRRLLQASHPDQRMHFDLIKHSFDQLQPGLVEEIESYPSTSSGIIQATAAIQAIGRTKGYIPARRR